MIKSLSIPTPRHKTFLVSYLGVVPYDAALEEQERLRQSRAEEMIPDAVLLLQHPHVYTVGRFHGEEDIIALPREIPVYYTSRGGSITYHGPGQLVGYPILHLKANGLGVREYIWRLEEVIIRLLGDFHIEAQRHNEYPGGVWVDGRKVCSIGINVSHHITTHGFALNVNNDLKYFVNIRPCGLRETTMTSMAEILGQPVPFDTVVNSWIHLFAEIFALKPEMDNTLSVEVNAIA